MIAPVPNEKNGRPTEAGTPVAPEQRVSTAPNAYTEYRRTPLTAEPLDEDVVGQIHAADDFATAEPLSDSNHRCEDDPTVEDVWYLSPEDAASEGQGEPQHVSLRLCLTCRLVARFRGASVTVKSDPWRGGIGGTAA